MKNLANFLNGSKVLEVKNSKINGELTVIKDLTWGIYIKGGGVTQSGGVAESVWKTSLKVAVNQKREINTALILGLGGGSIAKLIRKFWGQEVIITGVEIDQEIIKLAQSHMNLDKHNVEIKLEDAEVFIKNAVKKKLKFDLICIDMYVETHIPQKFENQKFLSDIKKILNKNGIAVFNRLYYGEKRKSANSFQKSLDSHFSRVSVIHPEANIMFLVKK